ncbi:MAG: thermopsin family protease [Thermoplasmata archaeon]
MVIPSVSGAPAALAPVGLVAHPAPLPSAVSSATSPVVNAGSVAKVSPVESQVLAKLHAANAPMDKVFLPNFNSRVSTVDGVVQPLYGSAPAPMGLGDFGVQDVHGVNVGTISYTTSVKSAVTFNQLDPLYLGAAGPDQFTIQENTVLNDVNVLGNTATDYWIQNVPVYYDTTHTLVFEDNIWNFSNPSFVFPPNGIYAHGPASFFIGDEVYIGVGLVSYNVAPPFTITTYNNATIYNHRPTIFFNYTLTKGGSSVSGSYDFAEFNSTGVVPKPAFQINGQSVNPTGYLLNDAEIMVGGPGGGSTTNFLNIAGSFGLWTLPNGSKVYKDVPSAYDFGTDTGETSMGLAEYSSGGPNPVARMGSGPSILYPLWGIVGHVPSGAVNQTLRISPSNAFVFITQGSTFNDNVAGWAPVPTSGIATYLLPPGSYAYHVELSDHTAAAFTLTGSISMKVVNLPLNTALGVYTPLWALSNAQLAGISSSGAGTIGNPYFLYNNQVGPIDPLFGMFNDFLFPAFSGIFLVNTNAYVSVYDAPSFYFNYAIQPEQATVVHFGLPLYNYLEQNYYHVSHVAIVDSPLITGWLFTDDVGFTEASVVFWNSSNNVLLGNTFQVMSEGLIIYAGAYNIVWGNVFAPNNVAAADPGAVGQYDDQLAMELWAGGVTTFNNAVVTPFTAYTPTSNIYNGAPHVYRDNWSIAPVAASTKFSDDGWSFSGSILGLNYVAGNYWGDYGSARAPYGVLPYDEFGLITVGGDYHPVLPFLLYQVVFTETGLPLSTPWSVTLGGITLSTTGSKLVFWDPNATYAYVVGTVSGHTPSPASGALVVNGAKVLVPIHWT